MITDILLGLFKPVGDLLAAREARKQAKESAQAKIVQAKQDHEHKVTLTDAEWEVLSIKGQEGSWKDEYVTVSVVSVFNIIIVGGVAAAYGHTEILEGVGIALQALTQAGVDVGMLLTATVFAAIGLKFWRTG